MARHKDTNWRLPDSVDFDQAKLAVLMDIRDELKRLNSLLHCSNFMSLPIEIRKLRHAAELTDRRLAKRTKLR